MQSNLNYLSAKQDVTAQNIANANTPNYSAKTLEKPDFSKFMNSSAGSAQSAAGGGLATTHKGHISGTHIANNKNGRIVDAESFETSPTGNKVVLEDEVMELTKTGMEYQETTNIYRKMMDMIRTSIGGQ